MGRQHRPGMFDSESAKVAAQKSAETRRRKAAERKAKKSAAAVLRRGMTILDALDLWPEFRRSSWGKWRAFLASLFGLPLDGEGQAIYTEHTGRQDVPTEPFSEAWTIVGRRGGKSRIAALVAVYLALFRDYSEVLSRGERGVVMVLAADRGQCRVIMNYARGFIAARPELAEMVEVERRESIDFTNGITLEVHTASYRAVRGYSVVGAVLDEVAYWRSDEAAASPDVEVLNALRPSMATVPGAVLLGISTPWARRGEVWKAYDRYYAQAESSVLVWAGNTRSMNPTVPKRVIERAYEDDPIAAATEYGGEFRRDIQAFITPEAVLAVVVPDRYELPYSSGVRYYGFCDPSGGSQDSMTLGIAHLEAGVAVLDCLREVHPPFNPDSVCVEFAGVLKSYRLHQVVGDKYGGVWPVDRFRRHGITYQPEAQTKSDLYIALLPMVNSGSVALLDNKVLRAQLVGLERRVSRSGKDSVDHTPGSHDDVVNVAAGALVGAVTARKRTATIGTFSI